MFSHCKDVVTVSNLFLSKYGVFHWVTFLDRQTVIDMIDGAIDIGDR